MSKDAIGWLITLVLLVAIVLGIMGKDTLAWVIVATGVAVLVFIKLKKD